MEPPPGIKHNLLNSFAPVGGIVSESMYEDSTVHRGWKRVLFNICMFHAVVQERWKFGAAGWNVPYEFISSDVEVCLGLCGFSEKSGSLQLSNCDLLRQPQA